MSFRAALGCRSTSQHTKLTLEKKTLPPLLPGFELATFRSRVRRSTNKLSRLPRKEYKVDNNPNKVTSSEKYDFQTACQEQVAIITPAANPRSLQVFYSALAVADFTASRRLVHNETTRCSGIEKKKKKNHMTDPRKLRLE